MLMRTDPFRELDRVAQQVFGTAARPAAMPIDAYRKGDEFVVLFDLPGIDASSIDLTVERNVLTVHAERARSTADDVELLIGERPHGTFSRQLFLAETLDTDRLAAEYTDGVLQLRVPVKEQAKPRRVDVAVGRGKATPIEATASATTTRTTASPPERPGRERASGAAPSATSRVRRAVSVPDEAAPLYTVSQAAAMLDQPTAFLRRLDSEGVVIPVRSPGGQRRYSRAEVNHVAALIGLMSEGMTLAGAQRIIELENEIAELRRRLAARDVADKEKHA